MYKLLVLSLLSVIGVSVGQILQDGQCDQNVPIFLNFNIDAFLGTWYEIAHTETEAGGDCSTIEFTQVGGAVTVFHKRVRENFYAEYHGQANSADGSARLSLNLPELSSNPIDFWVLSTDHSTFALTYGCVNVGLNQRQVYLWQLSRTTFFPGAMIPANLNTIMVNLFNITNDDLRDVSHSDDACYVLPIIEAGQPVILPGQCNEEIVGVADFRAADFLGVWHQIESYYSDSASNGCNRAQYSDGGDRVNVVNSQIINQTLFTIEGYANVISNDSSGQLNVTLEILPGVTQDMELLVLGTDYEQWAVTYTCVDLANDTKQVFSWVVSRTRQLPAAARLQVNQVINSLIELNSLYYETTDQSDAACFYFPETVVGEPIVFGGQCNLSIPVQANFSAVDYMGLWHEIERYPTPFQFGACNNAFYSLGDSGVDVFNTQVLNEQLLTINGLAIPVDDAKLVVYFPIEGTNATAESDYWVLSTDHSSYSLVYSCMNINDYQQQVTFWKLSRTKQLTLDAQIEINNVISSLDILNQDYFTNTDQSEEGCFYYPEPQPGVPVQFPGSCESDIPVVANFNQTLFQGEWFEIEAYPKDPQGGHCVNHQFSVGTGTAALNFDSSNVDNQLLVETSGQLTFYANETGGRFTLSFVSNGTTISFPYYVIATDYTEYALVYSCLDIEGTDFRGVWAWKLSRAKQLSPNATAQINSVLSNSPSVVLREEYFEPIDQSDNACFYFPDLAPGELVVLPGQCEDLPAYNVNISRYEGLWYLIESYPAVDQIGQCNQATYTVQDNVIQVYNNEVANQTLREIFGTAVATADGKLIVTFPDVASPVELLILGTDYDSYSFAYGCVNEDSRRRIQSWKFSRTKSLTPEATEAIDAITNNVTVLNNRYYQTVDQSDDACFYYPTPGAGPTIFRGQCDETIPVVTDFDAVAYMGLWHDIESYAIPFQDGDCPNAHYTLNADLGLVEVFNTQVVPNATLDTISGFAELIPSNDTSAKLLVTFPIIGINVTTPYWVLSTDYTSYAFVYSCQNIDPERRSVSSWKLSRTKSLSQNASDIIDGIINTIPVLDDQYYNVRDQTPEGCFYFPEPQPGVPVKFPGQCDANIPVVADFNLTQFEGDWFEIETYPKDTQPGECINHQFSNADSSSLDLISTNVFEQLLVSSIGSVTLYPNQTNGRLTLSVLDSNGTEISFPYYIIATDYTGYALVYSCIDIDDDYRGIYAWKLSRTKQLSAQAASAITEAMSDIDVLSNDYFEPVDQTDDACFYFPDLAPGEAVIMPGQCADVPVVTNFDAERYLGRWRLIESYPSDSQIGQCNQANYSLGANNNIIVYNNEVVNQTLSEITGTATLIVLTQGKLNVTFDNNNWYELWILDTDYSSYSFVYGCENLTNTNRRVWSWKMSRTTELTVEANAAIDVVINNITVLNQRYYQTVDQSDDACFYYPTPGAGPTIFRGQCDENIAVVTDFDAVAYMGLWHDIESYAVPFQDGDCPNAHYTLNADLGLVEVFNTQVVPNATLDTISGFAELIPSNDTSAKLLVTFPIIGINVTTPYWVLSTDYTSYAFVYSCQNIDPERRSVSSWKLSRTKSLSQNASDIIDGIINTISVLDDQYYNVRDQTPEGCFYFPEPQPGVPVKFPGQCDANIPVVADFNLTQFEGDWFEIETYPKDTQPGECINHQFSNSDSSSLDLISTNVLEQLLVSSVGSVTLYPNQTDGRLTLSVLDSNGTEISFPYYIIATDYTGYALVYSCIDIDDDYRGIYAWKLSRTKQLSAVAASAISEAMTDIDVLSNDYFEPVDQTDDACFYFPDLAPGEAVILPGQCADVPVVTNFDAERYLGRWRLIESYPSDSQIGQCNQANYSLGANNNIIVYNNEVVNQTLSEITGTATLIVLNEGKLNVTFDNNNWYELWILDTDYSSYSFVYGCENLTNTNRRVWSWKMSRTTDLTVEANAAIDVVINNITVLNQRYFQTVDQSDDACFYYPTPGAGPTIFRGQCDENIAVVTDFDAVAYMGLWHDIESYAIPFQDGDCPNAHYTLNADLGLVEVFNTQVVPNATLDTISGFAELIPSNDTSAKLLVTFPIMGINVTTPYWVLSTDYTSYAFVYSCQNIDQERRSVSSWKLSRTKSLNQNASDIIDGIINTIPVLDDQYYNVRDQTPEGCFYFPEPQPGVPVKFPGQCDATIPVVNNFDLNRFSGVWHEIETYPKEEQTGECINHEFTVNGNSLDMQSFNVIAQSLGVTDGVLEFDDNSTDARMTIRFTSNGTTIEIPYWIINTDYDNYAVAYSCVNIDEDYRGVWSWKLGRNKQLSAADNDAINNSIANIDVLGNQYYESVNQSAEACFFYPDTAPGEIVVFPGQCGDISAMPNFDAAAYLGLWRTIESYPSAFQLGTCGDATYSLDGSIVVVYNTEVVNGSLSTITGTATAATDGTGKLYVSFPGAPAIVEYLVLDTDYETYSIVYSCVNSINSDERTVFSWKLGRANVLPQAAITAINNKIDSIDVLDQRYYEQEDRSPTGCFYFPEPNNSTVVFRGQCDEDIAVQENFNAVDYMGIWYSIESYPAPFQDGTCGTASYTLADGVVLVENTQVLNEVLDIQTGIAEVVDNAKLAVTFEVNGINVTTNYWVLATDYSNFSLVYSCQNLNDEYKQVNSWKLSRTKSITAADELLINNAIENVQVLQQQYFVPDGQSEDDCFFYPDNEGGDVVLDGQCVPDNLVPAVTNFNVNLFAGTWHEVSRFPSDLQVGECAAANFSPGAQNSLSITQTIVENESQSINIIPGQVSNDGRGVISANVAGVPFNALYILDTDYTEYALVYGCRELTNETKQIYSWKLARSRAGLSPTANATINQVVSDNIDLFEGYYSYTEQTSAACFHYPVFEELPEAIELEGPCDETISGVPNFNAEAYLGVWREIERYPEANQFGTCDQALYLAGDGFVEVINSQVVDNSLLEQLGAATVASTDGSGLLSVNFTVNGNEVNANYYILATDYTSFSLVYSCRNTLDADGHEKRLISSWKLSRSRSLTAVAQTVINTVINQTQGLSGDYYQATDQSDDACFYIPEPTPDSAPWFRGSCEAVSAVANFDANRFVGWWHEVERYSVDANIGECISSQYSPSGNNLQVVDTNVANGIADIVTGTVTVANGVLTRVLSNGATQQIVVLETDYDNYALLYSCEDVTLHGEEYRRVWSAKHSRDRTLSSVNVAALNTTIDSNNVLYSQFYQEVDQSDQACFHYPEPQGQRVILPGQCDLNIPVVANFDVAAYAGDWYQIERYPQAHEDPSSTCIGARYTVDEGAGVVNVLNWEVIDGELVTIEGTATVSSDDGSAKLSVILPVVGTNETVTTSLYVLATDYEGYSLAYSCSNINAFQRSIGTWKLSRERTLSQEGAAAINAIMATREELDARYYVTVDHDEECPEPSSSALLKSSILVMLVCALIQLYK